MSGRNCELPSCNKKLRLTEGLVCKCGFLFCMKHRYSNEHNCTFDYTKEHQDLLSKNNPKIIGSKIVKI